MFHEKCDNNEMFIGNTKTIDVDRKLKELSSIESLRVGLIAYDIHGIKLEQSYYKPLFINKNEAIKYDRIMMTKLSSR